MKLSPKSKIEKVLSKDVKVLENPYLYVEEGSHGYLLASTGQNAVKIPVLLSEGDLPGPVPVEALKELRKVKDGELLCNEQYCILPNGAAWPRPQFSQYPPIESLLVDSGQSVMEISLNAKALYEIAQAQGCEVVKLKIEVSGDMAYGYEASGKTVGVEPHPSEPHVEGSRAALLPYRVARI